MGTKMERLLELQEAIGYRFKDERLLVRALTHTSRGGEHNQRLEFLGDAVVGLYAARLLYAVEPEMNEGEMSRARAAAVCETALYEAAKKFGLGQYLRLGRGEEQSGGRDKPSIVSDAFEALSAAIYLDGGASAADEFFERFLPVRAERKSGATDCKTRLQELLQSCGQQCTYRIVGESGPDHDKRFQAEVLSNGAVLARGEGHSKKEAEQEAARKALSDLG